MFLSKAARDGGEGVRLGAVEETLKQHGLELKKQTELLEALMAEALKLRA